MQLSSPSPVLDLFAGTAAAGGTAAAAPGGGDSAEADDGAFGALLNAESKPQSGTTPRDESATDDLPPGTVLGQQPVPGSSTLTSAEVEALALVAALSVDGTAATAGSAEGEAAAPVIDPASARSAVDVASGDGSASRVFIDGGIQGGTNAMGGTGVTRLSLVADSSPGAFTSQPKPAAPASQSGGVGVARAAAPAPESIAAGNSPAKSGGLAAQGEGQAAPTSLEAGKPGGLPASTRAGEAITVSTRGPSAPSLQADAPSQTATDHAATTARASAVASSAAAAGVSRVVVRASEPQRSTTSPVASVAGAASLLTPSRDTATPSAASALGDMATRTFANAGARTAPGGSITPSNGQVEKIAGENDAQSLQSATRRPGQQKLTLDTGGQEVASRPSGLGINAAKPDSLMPALAQPMPLPTAETEPLALPVGPLTFESLVNEAGVQTSESSGSARRAVESVMAVIDHLAQGTRRGVNLQFSVSGTDVAVRVEMRHDGVHTTFQTDSPELRMALAQEWHAVVATQSADRAQRLAEPVFTSTSAGGPTSADAGASQQRESGARQSQWETATNPAPPASLRSSSSTPAAAASTAPHLVPHATARHLHTFA